jgi:hypothetical protein
MKNIYIIKDKILKKLQKIYPEYNICVDHVRRKSNEKSKYTIFFMMYSKKTGFGGYIENYEIEL